MAFLARSFVVLCCLTAAVPLTAQREWHRWAFGEGAGITFVENGRVLSVPKQSSRTPVFQSEGTASISDPCSGELLFTSDGYGVYGASGSTLENGSMLLGENSATQAALLLPHPADIDKYVLFTAPDRASGRAKPGTTCSWNIIDRAAMDGRGAVTRKNVPLPLATSERLCAVLRPDGVSYWVVMMTADTTVFRVYALDAGGVAATPVVSSFPFRSHNVGYMKVSPNGSKLAIASPLYGVELFDFDMGTGLVSNRRVLLTDENRNVIGAQVFYGLEWSPDGSKLYVSSRGVAAAVVQFDVAQDRLDLIAMSAAEVMRQALADVYSWAFPLQLGPTGHIYIGAGESIHAITEPNRAAADCGLRRNVLTLQDARVNDGFPNIPAGVWMRPSQRVICPPPLPRFRSTPACAGAPVMFVDSSEGFPLQWFWQFSGGNPNQFSGKQPPGVRYAEPGTYLVSLRVQNEYGSAVFTDTVVIHPPPGVFAGRDIAACRGQTVSLDARTNATSFVWRPGNLVSDSTQLAPLVVVDRDSIVLALHATSEFGCEAVDTVVVRSRVVAAVVPADTAICQGETVFLTASGGSDIEWLLADGSSVAQGGEYFARPDTSTRYTVIVRAGGCIDTAYVSVVVNPKPVISVSADTSICVGDTISLTAGGGATYLWTPIQYLDDPTSATPRAFPPRTTTFRVTAISPFGCSSTSTVTVAVAAPGSLQLTPDTSICQGASVTLRASGTQAVAWYSATGELLAQSTSVTVQPLLTSRYTCTSLDARCPVTDTVVVTVVPQPRVEVIQADTACANQPVTLVAIGAVEYRWYDQDGVELSSESRVIVAPAQVSRLRVIGLGIIGCADTVEMPVAVRPQVATALAVEALPAVVQPGQLVKLTVVLDEPSPTAMRVRVAVPRTAIAVADIAGAVLVDRRVDGAEDILEFDVAASTDTVVTMSAMALLQGRSQATCRAFAVDLPRCVDVAAAAATMTIEACEQQRRIIAFVDRATIVPDPAGRGVVVSVPPTAMATVEFWSIRGERLWTTLCTTGVHRFDDVDYVLGWYRLTDSWGSIVLPVSLR